MLPGIVRRTPGETGASNCGQSPPVTRVAPAGRLSFGTRPKNSGEGANGSCPVQPVPTKTRAQHGRTEQRESGEAHDGGDEVSGWSSGHNMAHRASLFPRST